MAMLRLNPEYQPIGNYATSSHGHAASDITSGTLAIARIPTGSTSSTVPLGNHTHAASAITNLGTVYSNSVAKTISSSSVDSYTLGASVSLPAGTYVIVGQWYFATGPSQSARNMRVGIGPNTSTEWAQTRFYSPYFNWAAVQCTCIRTITSTTTVYVMGACSQAYTSGSTTSIYAVRIK